jgi:D-alanyl-D-alanine carboxypeptidase
MDGGGGGSSAAKEENEREFDVKNQKIRELDEELAVSKRLTADLMLNMNSVEQQIRKYAEEPVIIWSDDCECKQQVSAVADLLKKFIITEREANNSKPEATSVRNTKVDCETQTEANIRQRDFANADEQEIVRRMEDNRKLSALLEEYEWEILLMNEEMEHTLRERKSSYHIHHIKRSIKKRIESCEKSEI